MRTVLEPRTPLNSEFSTVGIALLGLRLAVSLALYTFLGWALLTLWRDLQRQNQLLTARQVPPISLLRQPWDGSRPYRFTSAEIVIGRDQTCDCCLDEKTVSGNHARLRYHQGQWWIEDLDSTNGTFLNNEPVITPLVLASDDELRCGQVVFTIAIGTSDESLVEQENLE
jgi:hypothetical protein